MLSSNNTNFVTFSLYNNKIKNFIFLITLLAVKASVGLSLIIRSYRMKQDLNIKKFSKLKF